MSLGRLSLDATREAVLSVVEGRLMRVYGHSMAPLLSPGELVFVREGAYASCAPRRGEIVAARPASLGGKALVKRIVGLPHERVKVGTQEWQLADEQFFLLGDQAEYSMDSRIFGPVSREELIGPVRLRMWPWKILVTESEQKKAAIKDEGSSCCGH